MSDFAPDVLDREEAENLLRSGENGDFVLRKKPNDDPKLSVLQDTVVHVIIHDRKTKRKTFGKSTQEFSVTPNKTFNSLPDLLGFYQNQKFLANGKPLKLKNRISPKFPDLKEKLEKSREDELKNLDNCHWFYNKLSKTEAEQILNSANFDVGCYLVRKPSDGEGYYLAFIKELNRDKPIVEHVSIHQVFRGDGNNIQCVYYFPGSSERFDSIEQLLIHYSAETTKLNTQLTFAPMREYFQIAGTGTYVSSPQYLHTRDYKPTEAEKRELLENPLYKKLKEETSDYCMKFFNRILQGLHPDQFDRIHKYRPSLKNPRTFIVKNEVEAVRVGVDRSVIFITRNNLNDGNQPSTTQGTTRQIQQAQPQSLRATDSGFTEETSFVHSQNPVQ